MTRLRALAISSATAAVMATGAVSQGFALEAGSFDNRLNGGTIAVPIGAAAPAGIYASLGTIITPNFYGSGNRSLGGSGINYPSVGSAVAILWSTGYNFLGAAYSVSAVQPFYSAGILPAGQAEGVPHGCVPNGVGVGVGGVACTTGSAWNSEIANTIWNPINLSWNLGQGFFVSVGFDFMGPDGSQYGAGNLNPDYWTFEPTLAFAYLSKSWAISVNMFYDINTASHGNCCLGTAANGYTGGNEFYVDWAALYLFGKWSFGPVGYAKAQTTADQFGGTATLPSCATPGICGRDAAIALGALVGYDFGPVAFQVWVTDAVYQHDDINGFAVWWRLAFRVWAPESPKPLVAKN